MGKRGLVSSPYDVTEEDFDLAWIARSLSRIGRYLGNGAHFLSVAEHSVELSFRVSQENAFCALMHDAPEAFVGDLHGYIKQHMLMQGDFTYRDLEQHFWSLVANKYMLPQHLPEEVKSADLAIRSEEMESLFYGGPHRCFGLLPRAAEEVFIARAADLMAPFLQSVSEAN